MRAECHCVALGDGGVAEGGGVEHGLDLAANASRSAVIAAAVASHAAQAASLNGQSAARGALVRSSKSGDGRASPRTHQPNIVDARRAKTPNEGGAGAFGGSGPT